MSESTSSSIYSLWPALLVAVAWGATNPFLRRGVKDSESSPSFFCESRTLIRVNLTECLIKNPILQHIDWILLPQSLYFSMWCSSTSSSTHSTSQSHSQLESLHPSSHQSICICKSLLHFHLFIYHTLSDPLRCCFCSVSHLSRRSTCQFPPTRCHYRSRIDVGRKTHRQVSFGMHSDRCRSYVYASWW